MRCLNTPLLSSLCGLPHTPGMAISFQSAANGKVILIFPVSFWLPPPSLPISHTQRLVALTDGAQPSTRKGQFGSEAHCLHSGLSPCLNYFNFRRSSCSFFYVGSSAGRYYPLMGAKKKTKNTRLQRI